MDNLLIYLQDRHRPSTRMEQNHIFQITKKLQTIFSKRKASLLWCQFEGEIPDWDTLPERLSKEFIDSKQAIFIVEDYLGYSGVILDDISDFFNTEEVAGLPGVWYLTNHLFSFLLYTNDVDVAFLRYPEKL